MGNEVEKSNPKPEPAETRLDKWLWAARFFKTRSQAAEAVSGGKVHLDGRRTKPAKPVRVGNQLTIHQGIFEQEVTVLAIRARRGPASVARLLYSESEASIAKREQLREQIKAERPALMFEPPAGRPNKKQRRQIISFTKHGSG